ncbi:hypothetical protein NECAME_05573 [Necator americanus]|uniref:Uncharacterized protein n=1 Tax=Necator americanus TaxID=51031 RepID=W2SFX0_NECAM|nr:hypothetical protein NECAME_05573 [Necator americanus]ETN68490.1 hypothetical protein NECAME_05573 [Necator americanus]
MKPDAGEGEMKRRAFNTCLKHVINKHAWEQTTETSLYTSCGHAPLQASRQEALTEGSRASSRFREMLLNRRLQEDLLKASSHGLEASRNGRNTECREESRGRRKYLSRTFRVTFKASIHHQWRDEVAETVLRERERQLRERDDDDDDETEGVSTETRNNRLNMNISFEDVRIQDLLEHEQELDIAEGTEYSDIDAVLHIGRAMFPELPYS